MPRTNSLPAARPRASFESLPVTLDLSPARTETIGRFVAAILMLAFAFYIQREFAGLEPAGDAPVLTGIALIPLAFLGLAGAFAVSGGFRLLSRRTARIDRERVSVTGRTPLGREEWSAPLSAFRGVAWRIVRKRSGRRSRRTRIYQVIELVHPDPERTLPLHVRQTKRDARDEWEAIARALNVPAIDDREGAGHVRQAADLDKSLRELAAEGRAEVSWQPSSVPPAGLSWESRGEGPAEALVVRLHARRLPFWLYAAGVAFGAFFLFAGLADPSIPAVLIGGALIAGVVWYWLTEPHRPRGLRLTREDIRLADPMPLGADAGPLRLDGIEEIRVVPGRSRLAGAGALLIASDAGEICTGQGLSREALEWLRDYLTAAVVGA